MEVFLSWGTTFVFLLTTLLYIYRFVKNEKGLGAGPSITLSIAIVFNIIYMVSLAYSFRRFPLSSFPEALNFIATAVAISYLAIEIFTKNRNTGVFILTLVFLFKLFSAILMKENSSVNPILANWYFIFHVIPSTLGYTAFSLSMIYGLLYLMLYNELHQKKFGPFFDRLPPLEGMERMIRISVKLGFVLLTIGILAGLALSKATFSVFFKWDPKMLIIMAIWLVYFMFLILAARFSWKGKRYAISSIMGFSIILAALAVVQLFLKSFHTFV